MRVLVVDDEALIVLLTASWLEELGCEVETALNGTEALAKLNDGDPSVEVLITDVNMPGMSGYELAKRATAVRPGLQVVLLSGAEDKQQQGLPLIRKPFFQDDLWRIIKTLR
jgi:CheY-like chemotaxis protein